MLMCPVVLLMVLALLLFAALLGAEAHLAAAQLC